MSERPLVERARAGQLLFGHGCHCSEPSGCVQVDDGDRSWMYLCVACYGWRHLDHHYYVAEGSSWPLIRHPAGSLHVAIPVTMLVRGGVVVGAYRSGNVSCCDPRCSGLDDEEAGLTFAVCTGRYPCR